MVWIIWICINRCGDYFCWRNRLSLCCGVWNLSGFYSKHWCYIVQGSHSEFITNWQNTGKFAFRRDGYEFVFHAYRLPVEKWTKIRIEGDIKGTSLFVDGQLLERLEGRIGEVFNVKHQRKDRIWYQETLIFPLKQLGDTQMGFNGKVKNLICTPRWYNIILW